MFRNRSSVAYRIGKSRTGKKLKNHMSLLFVVSAVVAALVLTVIWGIVWGKEAQESALRRAELREEEKALAADTPEWLPARPEPIQAYAIGEIISLENAVSDAVLLTESGATALSLPLYANGTPRYLSAVAQALGRQRMGETDVTLSRLLTAVPTEEVYLAATFSCTWQTESDKALRRVLRTYEAALVAEIAAGGAHEVLLLDLTADSDTIDEVALFLREIRENCPEAVVGVAVSTAFLADDHHVERIRTLLTWADHVALDLGDYNNHTIYETTEDGNPTRRVATLSDVLQMLTPAIKRYRMRLLLPADMSERLESIEELGYADWQMIP